MPTVAVDQDTELHYEDRGQGRPVVLIHGWPLSGAAWQPQVPALLDAGYRVLTYDRRGFGESAKPETGYDYDTLATDLAALLTELDLHQVTLVGFSMGGGEVVRYLSRHGSDRVHSAVLAAAVPPYLYQADDNPDGGLDDTAIAEMEGGLREDREAFFDQFMTAFFSAGDDLMVTEQQRQDALSLCRQSGETAALACIGAFARTDFRGDLQRVTVPTLVIHGDADGTVPFEVSGRRTHETLGSGQLHVVSGGPHGINTSHTEEFNRALLGFLARR